MIQPTTYLFSYFMKNDAIYINSKINYIILIESPDYFVVTLLNKLFYENLYKI